MMHLGSGGRSAGRSAKISLNTHMTYETWQIWVLIVDICNCHVGSVLGVLGGVKGGYIWHDYHANWLFTTLIIHK